MAEAVLELDIGPALEALDSLSDSFDNIIAGLSDDLAQAFSGANIDISAGSISDVLLPEIQEVQDALADVTAGFGEGLDGAISDVLLPQIGDVADAVTDLGGDFNSAFSDTGGLDAAGQDVQDLSEGLDTLEASIGQTASGMEILNSASGVLQATSGLLVGDQRSLLESLVPQAAIFGGIAAAIGGLVEKADAAELSLSRMKDVFGFNAPAVFDDQLEHLNGTLSELNKEAGGSNTKLREALATFGQTAIGAGATQKEAAKVTRSMGELAEVVTILNPRLGTADQNFQLISRGLGGSTRILQRYGITIDKAAQSQLALQIAQEHGRTAATLFDKQVAGSVLAMQALEQQSRDAGTTLQERVNKGLESSTVQFRKFKQEVASALTEIGGPLIGPVLNLVEKFTPIFIKLIGIVGEFAAKIVPAILPLADAFIVLLEVVEPVLDLFNKIPTEVLTGIIAFKLFTVVLGNFSSILGSLSRFFGPVISSMTQLIPGLDNTSKKMTALQEAQAAAAKSSGSFTERIQGIAPNIITAAAGIAIGIASISEFGETLQGTIGTIGGFASAGASIGAIFGQPLAGAAIGSIVGLTAGLIAGGESLDEYRSKFVKLGQEIEKQGLTGVKAFNKFVENLGDTDAIESGLFNVTNGVVHLTREVQKFDDQIHGAKTVTETVTPNFHKLANELQKTAEGSLAAGNEVFQYIRTLKVSATQSFLTARGYNVLALALEKGARKHIEAKLAVEQLERKEKDLEDRMRSQRDEQDEQLQSAIRYVTAVKRITDTVDELVPKFDKLNDGFDGTFKKAGEISKAFGDGVVDIHSFAAALDFTSGQATDFQNNLKVLVDNGLGFLASEIAAKGPEEGGRLAEQIANGIRDNDAPTIELAKKIQAMVITMEAQKFVFKEAIKNLWGKGIASEFTTQFDEAAQATAQGFGLVFIELENGKKKLVPAGSDQAKALADAFVAGIEGRDIPKVLDSQFDEAGNRIEKNETAPAKSKAAGKKHGDKFADGAATGITEGAPKVEQAAADLMPTGGIGAEKAGKTVGTNYGSTIAEGIVDEKGEIHDATVKVIPTGGVGAEDWGRRIGQRFGVALSNGIEDERGTIRASAASVIPTGGLGAEDKGHTIGVRFGHGVGDGIHDSFGYVRDSAQGIIPTGGLGAQDAGYTIGHRFGEAMAKGMYDTWEDVYATGRFLAQMAALGAANAGSPSEHLFRDIGEGFMIALAEGINKGSNEVVSVTQRIVRSAADVTVPALRTSAVVSGGISRTLDTGASTSAPATAGSSSVTHDRSINVAKVEVVSPEPERAAHEVVRSLRDIAFLGVG